MTTTALLVGLAPAGATADARLDRSFGESGWVTTEIGGGKSSSLAYGATVTGGKVVLAGQTEPSFGKDPQVVVARYRANGRLDREFGRRGLFVSELPRKDGPFQATDVVPAGSGRLLVSGGYGQGSMLALRLTKRGRLDRSFGKRGIAIVEGGDIAHSVTLGQDGSILLGSSDLNVAGRPMVVARLTPDGELDASFGSAGLARIIFWDPVAASGAGVEGLHPTADGGVIGFSHIDYIGGSGGSSGGHGAAGVFQLGSDGQPAPGFGAGGTVQVDFMNRAGTFAQWFPCASGVDSQGRITITGDGTLDGGDGFLTVRLTSAGVLDPTYGAAGDGRAFLRAKTGSSAPTCGGTVDPTGTLTAGVLKVIGRLTPEGAADTAFGAGGVVGAKRPKGVAIQAVEPAGANRIVVAGSAKDALYVARYRLP